MNPYDLSLIEQGLARVYRGRLIPIIRGGDGRDEQLFDDIPEDLAALDDEALAALVESFTARVQEIAADHTLFVNDDRDVAALLDETQAAVEALEGLRQEQTQRAEAAATAQLPEDPTAALAELAGRARAAAEAEPEPDPEDPEPEPEPEAAAVEPVVAAAVPAVRPPLPKPPASRQPAAPAAALVALTATAGAPGLDPGTPFDDEIQIAKAMIERRRHFGRIPDGVKGEQFPVARADWAGMYPDERRLTGDEVRNEALVASVVNQDVIQAEMKRRREGQLRGQGLVASGGLCAPVTPYYQLEFLSVTDRPVRAALPSFNADRGGIRYARPAGLSAISTAVGTKTMANDFAGGTEATKTCQVIACPPFTETDIQIIYHCLQFGNVGARVFPELVAQWNQLVLASHARTAESLLLSGIDTASTQVTAATMGLGAVGDLLGQILTAAAGVRNRNRMAQDGILRLMLPAWVLPMMVSDVIRSQFERFDTDEAKLTAWFRSQNVEPTFYIDGAAGKSQVFGTQAAGALLTFPAHATWYLFPEGSFLYIDGGTLELGVVRDSVLNATNDFQIFGESFENVAFIGIESLAVTSAICDNGVVSAPHATSCPSY